MKRKDIVTETTVPVMATLDKNGHEVVDSVPMAPPVGYRKQPSMTERIRDMVRSEHLRLAAIQSGNETFDEADDFEVGDDYDPKSPYEETFDPVDAQARFELRNAEYRASVDQRMNALNPEVNNGSSSAVEGREVGDKGGASGASGKSKPVGGKDKKAGVQSSVRERDSGDPLDD